MREWLIRWLIGNRPIVANVEISGSIQYAGHRFVIKKNVRQFPILPISPPGLPDGLVVSVYRKDGKWIVECPLPNKGVLQRWEEEGYKASCGPIKRSLYSCEYANTNAALVVIERWMLQELGYDPNATYA